MKNCNNFSTILCSFGNNKNMKVKEFIGKGLTMVTTCKIRLSLSKRLINPQVLLNDANNLLVLAK